jgi:hypothetical protein
MRSAAMRRPVLLGAAWTASAAAAVGLGFLAVSLVDASASPGTSPVAATSSTDDSATATPTGESPPSDAPASSATGEYPTVGGTVYANCTGGQPVLAGVPAAGWWVDDSDDPGEVEFKNDTQKVEVHVTCGAAGPQFFLEGPRADDSGRGDDGTRSSSPASSSSGHPTGDDSDGRDNSGHGSDDPPGDDNSGRGGGGHGSDD